MRCCHYVLIQIDFKQQISVFTSVTQPHQDNFLNMSIQYAN